MNEQETPEHDELRDRWIESLLSSATRPEEHADRIANVLHRIESESSTAAVPDRRRRRFVRWGTVAVAAALLVALWLVVEPGGTARTAMAAVERSLDVAAERTTREYSLAIGTRSPTGETRTTVDELYVQGNDRFALRHPGLLAGTSFGSVRMVRNRGFCLRSAPVLKGNNTGLSRWLRSRGELDTPYLHVSTVLTRMKSRGYQLETLAERKIATPDGRTVPCQRVRASRTDPGPADRPHSIELWANRETGMAMRVIARWSLDDGESGRESITLTYRNDAPSLPDDWFTAEAHYSGHRPVLRMDK